MDEEMEEVKRRLLDYSATRRKVVFESNTQDPLKLTPEEYKKIVIKFLDFLAIETISMYRSMAEFLDNMKKYGDEPTIELINEHIKGCFTLSMLIKTRGSLS